MCPFSWRGQTRLDATLLGWTAPVMRYGSDVSDRPHLQASALHRANCRLSTRPGALHKDVHLANAHIKRAPGNALRCDLRGIWRAPPRSLERRSQRAWAAPENHVALLIRKGDQGIVECCLDVHTGARHCLSLAPPSGPPASSSCLWHPTSNQFVASQARHSLACLITTSWHVRGGVRVPSSAAHAWSGHSCVCAGLARASSDDGADHDMSQSPSAA